MVLFWVKPCRQLGVEAALYLLQGYVHLKLIEAIEKI